MRSIKQEGKQDEEAEKQKQKKSLNPWATPTHAKLTWIIEFRMGLCHWAWAWSVERPFYQTWTQVQASAQEQQAREYPTL